MPTVPEIVRRRVRLALSEAGIILDRGTQPCYAAAMLDIDSRPLIEPMNDLSIMSGLGPPPPFEGPGANRFAGRCTEFDLTNGFRTNFDKAEMPPLFEVIRCLLRDSVIDLLIFAVDRDTRVTNVLNRCKLDHKTSVLNSMSGVLRGFRVCGDSEVVGQMADFLEKAT